MEHFDLLTTTRYDPALSALPWNDDEDGPSPYFLLPYHHERLQVAARHHGWTSLADRSYPQFKAAVADVVQQPPSALRVRILLCKSGELRVTATVLEASFADDPFLLPTYDVRVQLNSALMDVYIDTGHTVPSIFTQTKTTFRSIYDEAKWRNGLAPLSTPAGKSTEILLHNTNGFVMETSIFNVAFRRGSRWLTPGLDTGCLPGVARRWLLEHGRVDEDLGGTLSVAKITDGELVLLFNGVQGCRLGKIVRRI